MAAMAEGTSRLLGLADAGDVRASIAAVQRLGAQVSLERQADGSLCGGVRGWGAQGPREPDGPIDCGNSGTTARLLLGMLAPWDIAVALTGDASLRARPMGRVVAPLMRMGARFKSADADALPLAIQGTRDLRALSYEMPVASAQVKTAILLAGTYASGTTEVFEPAPSRNHTELMLPEFGVETVASERAASVTGPAPLRSAEVSIPGDASSAAFLACAAVLVPGSAVQIENVSLNPLRTGFVRTLERMGADVEIRRLGTAGKESYGIISACHAPRLRGCEVPGRKIASIIDEIPVLALVAACAHGVTVFRDAGELRVKESNRMTALVEGLNALGVAAWFENDDLMVEGAGGRIGPAAGALDAHGDHRIAMTWALAGMVGAAPIEVAGFDSVSASYPQFADDIERLVG